MSLVARLITLRDRPQPVFIRRNDRSVGKTSYGQPENIQRNTEFEDAPRPPIDSRFQGIGRDPQHAPTGIITYGGGLAMTDWLSVAAWPFQIAKVPSAMVVRDAPNRGRMNPFMERPNIQQPSQTNLGDLYALSGGGSWSPSLAKITN